VLLGHRTSALAVGQRRPQRRDGLGEQREVPIDGGGLVAPPDGRESRWVEIDGIGQGRRGEQAQPKQG
jgi:hypothetical protein